MNPTFLIKYVEIAQLTMPNLPVPEVLFASSPKSREMIITKWHVPVDDETCYWCSMFTSFDKPLDKRTMREQRLKEHRLPDYAPIKKT